MKQKETKYFMKGTQDEVLIGDTVEVNLSKEIGKGRKLYKKIECTVTANTLPYLLDTEIIEAREIIVEKEEKTPFRTKYQFGSDFDLDKSVIELIKAANDVSHKIDTLEKQIKNIRSIIETVFNSSEKGERKNTKC